MSKKAEERALECYPAHEFFSKDINRRDRNIFLQGYQLAEKDHELTWEDIKRIVNIADDMIDLDVRDELPECCKTEQGYYEEILKKYNERKNHEQNKGEGRGTISTEA